MKIKYYRIIVTCLLFAVISACGQSGRLSLPEPESNKFVEKSQANVGKIEE